MASKYCKKSVRVRITRPANRSYAVRYRCPETNQDVRVSVGSRNESEAEALKQQIEARLTIGLAPRPEQITGHPDMSWSEFRHEYTRLKLSTLRDSTAASTENRLDVCETIVRPKRLSDLANPQTLERLKEELLAGTASRRKKPRSPHTVNSYLAALTAALNWGCKKGWLEKRVPKQLVSADDPSKGRPLVGEEIDRMLAACDTVCKRNSASWKYLILGLVESGLRVGEAMNLSFDIPGSIQIVTNRRGTVIDIPGKLQKNGKSQTLPITPAFMELLKEHDSQRGWVFNPTMQNGRDGRPTKTQVSRVVAKIGRKANIVVNDGGKPASAHDLRRTFGQRLADAGVTPRDLRKIMRHQRIETTEQFYLRDDAFEIADRISAKLNKSPDADQQQPLADAQIWHK